VGLRQRLVELPPFTRLICGVLNDGRFLLAPLKDLP